MSVEEPPEDSQTCVKTIYVGRDSRGCWIAQDNEHLRGGLFVSRAAAMKFAMDETNHHPEAIVALDQTVELDFGQTLHSAPPLRAPYRHAA
jgi:hypothetical protein